LNTLLAEFVMISSMTGLLSLAFWLNAVLQRQGAGFFVVGQQRQAVAPG